VLRRLKSLTIRYENAWWDIVGRGYEEEVATGIVSAYRIARQVSGPRRPGAPLSSWVTWTPQFHESLQAGNIKRLDLDVFFRLQTPTAQRLYRFLDKRFYASPELSMDLVELACGHVGLTDAGNVALLKRRLAPAIEELESIGFIAKADLAERYQKVKVGVWRIHFRAGSPPAGRDKGAPPVEPAGRVEPPGPALELARAFYALWDPAAPAAPGPRDLEQARALLEAHGEEEARQLLGCLVRVTRKGWPECRSLSGAAQKYLPEARKLHTQERRRQERRQQGERAREQTRQAEAGRQEQERKLQEAWARLPEAERQALDEVVRGRLGPGVPDAFVRKLCLEELARRPS
jgi:hypothetical protein